MDGQHLLPEVLKGQRIRHRESLLLWPLQPRPPAGAWQLWNSQLSMLLYRNKLSTPLGQWLNIDHQSWQMFVDPDSNTLYQQKQGSWFSAPPRTSSTAWYTCSSSRPTYDLSSTSSSQPLPRSALPATLIGGPPHRASVSLSPNSIPSLVHSAALPSTIHPYYEQLLNWEHYRLESKLPLVVASLTNGDLHICPDGSYDKRRQCGSHSWFFSTASRRIIFIDNVLGRDLASRPFLLTAAYQYITYVPTPNRYSKHALSA